MNNPKCLLILISLTLLQRVSCQIKDELQIVQSVGNYSKELEFNFNKKIEHVIVFPESQSINPFRVKAWSQNATTRHPILLVVRQEREVLSWQIPFLVETSKKDVQLQFKNTSRTLCHNNMDVIATSKSKFSSSVFRKELTQTFIVALSTSSSVNVDITLIVEEETGFYVQEDVNYSISVSPSQTRYVYYQFDETPADNATETVVIEVDSVDDICLTVSVQDSWCPVFDLDKDITYEGKYQTVNRKGALSIRRKDFLTGFFLVFVAKGDNFECSQDNSIIPMPRNIVILPVNRTSLIDFKIKSSISGTDYLKASLITLAFIVGFYVICIGMVCGFSKFGTISKAVITTEEPDEDLIDATLPVSRTEIQMYLEKPKLDLKSLAKYPLKDKRRSFNYLWHILSIAIFYSIPVVQLVITYQRVVNQTGDQDMCYYNFLCAHPAWGLSDFNHVFSNVGYIFTGILFLIVILHRHASVPFQFERGIPVHYGLFYAMGVALIIEGLLSACYHICPSQSNYQFDTSFMYVMAVLCMIKLYQNRHPDINATAYATFTVLGIAIFLAMVGILNGNLAVWILFVVVYSILCIYISFKIYFLSFVLSGIKRFKEDITEFGCKAEVFAPIKKSRFILLLISNLINLTMLVTGLCLYDTGVTDFGTFLLGLLMANSVLHVFFYITMKLLNQERICVEAMCYGLLGVATWAAGGVFFLKYATLWTVTPAESRTYNQDCIIMGFYDTHDIWHLLSAPALYFTFMFLLSLDDDIFDRKQEDIPVF